MADANASKKSKPREKAKGQTPGGVSSARARQPASPPATAPGAPRRPTAPAGYTPSTFTFQPGSLTCVIARDQTATGLIQAWDSLRLPCHPCGWMLTLDGCTKGTKCTRSHDAAHQDAAAIAKIKAACTPALLAKMH